MLSGTTNSRKAIKGLLIYYNVEPQYTHDIGVLLEELMTYVDISEIKESIKLTRYAVQTRYPGEYDDITKEEYENAVKIAKNCLEWAEKKIKENEEDKNNN